MSNTNEKLSPKIEGLPIIDISICMVSLNCFKVLKDCLLTIPSSISPCSYEIIIVDNASSDRTLDELENFSFKNIKIIRNTKNLGFTKATNQGIKLSSGRYILWLNTDTILKNKSIKKMYDFLESYPQVGIVGPKVLNSDGTFQAQCRRGFPTPIASLAYLLKLYRLKPHNKILGQYLLNYLPVDQACQVESVSGCCLMARREVVESIGLLDEAIFGFGEDIDWCVRARKSGWEVWYYPGSQIVHLGGQGGVHAKPYHKIWGIHQAMFVFYHKHLKSEYPWIIWLLVISGIGTSFLFSLILQGIRQGFYFIHR